MRTTQPSSGPAGVLGARAIIAIALLASLLFLLGHARPAFAADGTFKLSSATYSGTEGGVVHVSIVSTGRDGSSPLKQVGYVVTPGTALAGSDYLGPANGCIAFAAGSTTASDDIDFTLVENPTLEPNESFTVTLVSDSCDTVNLAAPASATVTILDNDGPGVFRFESSNSSVTENTTTVSITVIRTGDLSANETVDCDRDSGTATPGSDFTFSPDPKTLTFSAGISSRTCTVQILEDSSDEGPETVHFTLTNALGGATTIDPGADEHTLTINDDDGQTIQFAEATYTVSEGAGQVSLTLTRTNPDADGATVQYQTVSGTATAADYTPESGTVNFTTTSTNRTISIDITQDSIIEGDHSFTVVLSSPTGGASLGSPSTATVTIEDDENVGTLYFSATNYDVNEGDGQVTLTVNRSGGTTGSVSVEYETVSGTATSSDYTPESGTLNFSSGVSARTITIDITQDTILESTNQSFTVRLFNPTGGASLGDPDEATVTILDDDGPTPTVTGLSPTSGPTAGGTIVTITGTNFLSVTAVTFGGVATTNYVVNSSTSISAVSPAHTAGVADVRVTTPSGQSANTTADDFTYGVNIPTITSVSPTTVPTTGGTVVITGTNFSGATAVTVCGVNASSFTINSATQITAVLPARSAGACDIRVTTSAGQSANTAADNVTYQAATTNTYQLSFRWTLMAWLGKDGMQISSALQGVESPDNPATNNVLAVVTAIATWDGPTQRYLFWFPGGASVPGANDITTFKYGAAYWVAVTSGVSWTIIQGP